MIQRRLVQVTLAALVAHNIYLERTGRRELPYSLCLLHTVIFVARRILTMVPLYLLNFSGSKKLSAWGLAEDLVVRTLGFMAHHSKVVDVNATLLPLAGVISWGFKTFRYLNIEKVDLGLGGEREDAVWITLNKDIALTDNGNLVILYFHGGGYSFGSADMYCPAFMYWLKRLEKQGVTAGILSIEYPLAPRFKFPIQLEWAVKSYDAVVGLGLSPSQIIVAGDSAGGGLAIRCCLHGYEIEKCKPGSNHLAGLVLISPWVNHSTSSASHVVNSGYDYISGASDHAEAAKLLRSFSEAYCDDIEVALTDPSISLLHLPSFAALPPTMITLGSKEVFHDDVAIFSAKAKKDNVPVSTHLGEEMPHIWPMLWPGFKKEAAEALQEMADFCANRVALRRKIKVSDKWSEKVSTSMGKRNLTNLNLVSMGRP